MSITESELWNDPEYRDAAERLWSEGYRPTPAYLIEAGQMAQVITTMFGFAASGPRPTRIFKVTVIEEGVTVRIEHTDGAAEEDWECEVWVRP